MGLKSMGAAVAIVGLSSFVGQTAHAETIGGLPKAEGFFDTGDMNEAPARCKDFVEYSFGKRGDAAKKRGFRADGMVVLKDNQVVYEHYRAPWTRETPHALWSASKSVSHALLGTAVMDARLAEQNIGFGTKVSTYYPRPELPNTSSYFDVTLDHLVHMGAGFQWSESYAAGLRNSSVTQMYYGDQFFDMAGFASGRPMIAEGPGKKWNYSSGNTNLVMGVLKRAYGASGEDGAAAYDAMPWTNLFDVLGMESAAVERDSKGVFIGATYIHMRPIDMAKIGMLYLDDGMWNGKRLLPEGWVTDARTIADVYKADPDKVDSLEADGVYAGGFWLNANAKFKAKNPSEIDAENKPYPRTDENMFGAFGHYGQYIFVFPTQRLVIVRTGNDTDFTFPRVLDEFYVRTKACFAPEGS
ncbi:MAG: serine hydrolase [Polyangiaceae bacterium]